MDVTPIFLSLLYGSYLSLLPSIVPFVIPCLHPPIGSSFAYSSCNTVFVLDRFVTLALIGAVCILMIHLIVVKRKLYRKLITTSLIMGIMIISAYYLYTPNAERAIRRAPILLESLR